VLTFLIVTVYVPSIDTAGWASAAAAGTAVLVPEMAEEATVGAAAVLVPEEPVPVVEAGALEALAVAALRNPMGTATPLLIDVAGEASSSLLTSPSTAADPVLQLMI
jgi:hypothetical protein